MSSTNAERASAARTGTERMDVIANDLAEEGLYTRAAAVYEVTRERDFLRNLIERIAYAARGHDAMQSGLGGEILGLISDYEREHGPMRCNAKTNNDSA